MNTNVSFNKSVILILFLLVLFPIKIYSQQPYVQILMSPEDNSWECEVGHNKSIYIQVIKNYIPVKDVNIEYVLFQEGMPIEKSASMPVSDDRTEINIGTLDEPGFKSCKVSVVIDDMEYTNTMTVGFSPDLIKPTVNDPKDFDSFWRRSIQNMRKSKYTVEIKPVESLSSKDVEVSLLHLVDKVAKIDFYGYFSKPKKAGKYPVVLFVPAAGVKPPLSRTNFINRDAITLSLEIHGLDPTMDEELFAAEKKRLTGYPFFGLENREEYYFHRGVLSCVRAGDFLCSLPEFDGKNFAVFGGSQGGYLSIATTALHEKVSCFVAFHPAMSDVTGYLHNRVGGWPHVFKSTQNGKYEKPQIIETLSYYDTVNFAKRLKVPGFYSFGYNDETCPPTTSSAVLNSIRSPMTLFLTPITGHWRIPEMTDKAVKWLKESQFSN